MGGHGTGGGAVEGTADRNPADSCPKPEVSSRGDQTPIPLPPHRFNDVLDVQGH